MKNSYHKLIDVLSAALVTNQFNDRCKATLFKYPVLLQSFIESFPEHIDISTNLPDSHNYLTMAAMGEIFLDQLTIILDNEIYRNALLERPGGSEGWTALKLAWHNKNYKAVI
jgi:hypothetical protein